MMTPVRCSGHGAVAVDGFGKLKRTRRREKEKERKGKEKGKEKGKD
jgi:DNA-directed RNA polymerase subunit N (RpoN/RPB10)